MSDALAALVREVKSALYGDQPFLDVRAENGKVIVEGAYLLLPTISEHRDRGAFARHSVRVEIAPDYPAKEPRVQMRDRSIPWAPEYHCDERGVCCITAFETWRATCEDASIGAYFRDPFRNFFLSQYLRHHEGEWPFGEWDHGKDGFVAAAAEAIGCHSSREIVLNILAWRAHDPKGIVAMADPCPCRSDLVAADCCGSALQRFSMQISAHEAKTWMSRLTGMTIPQTSFAIKQHIHRNRPFRKVW